MAVKVGQVWEDNDYRSKGRQGKVVQVGQSSALISWFGSKRETRVRLDRMRPSSTGYKLVTDVED